MSQEWADEFELFRNNPPQEGDHLKTYDGSAIKLEIKLDPGKEPLVFAKCYLHCKVDEKVGWFCRGFDDEQKDGWVCILRRKARDRVIRQKGLQNQTVGVKTLLVLGYSKAGNAIMVEIAEW